MYENKKFVKVYSKELRKTANSWKGGLKESSLFLFNNYFIDMLRFKNNNIDLCKKVRIKLSNELNISERQINARIRQLEKNGILIRSGPKNKKIYTVTVATMQNYKYNTFYSQHKKSYTSPTVKKLHLFIKKHKI